MIFYENIGNLPSAARAGVFFFHVYLVFKVEGMRICCFCGCCVVVQLRGREGVREGGMDGGRERGEERELTTPEPRF